MTPNISLFQTKQLSSVIQKLMVVPPAKKLDLIKRIVTIVEKKY